MARPMKPLVRSGGYYPSNRWTPLVYPGGYTTMNGGEEPAPPPIEKTVTGNPIHILDALAKPAQALSVKLEPIQDLHGYDNPWPAGGGKNLCDPSTIIVGFWDGTGTYSADANYKTSALIPVEPNTNYTGTFFKADKTEVNKLVYTEWDSSENFIRQSTALDSFVTTANTAYVRVRNYNAQSSLITSNNFLYQFEKGSATSYAPYSNICPISGMTDINITRLGGVVADGTPEVLTVTGKNLFDISAYDDERVWAGTGYKYIAIPLPNGTYTISWDKSKGGGFYWLAQVDGTKKGTSSATSGGSWLWHNTNTSLQRETFTFTVTEGYVYFSCSFGGFFVQKFLPALRTVQIEKGSTATAYESYSAQTASVENLLAVGNYKDEQDIISGLLTHKCGVLILDGTEGWTLTQTANVYIANNLAANALKSDTTPACLCTHYKGVAPSIGAPGMGALSIKMGYGGEGGSELARNRVYLKDTTVGSADGLINFLKAQYAAGTPVIVVYPLAAETTEQTTAQQIMAHAGSNTISVSPANVSNINLEVKYWTS